MIWSIVKKNDWISSLNLKLKYRRFSFRKCFILRCGNHHFATLQKYSKMTYHWPWKPKTDFTGTMLYYVLFESVQSNATKFASKHLMSVSPDAGGHPYCNPEIWNDPPSVNKMQSERQSRGKRNASSIAEKKIVSQVLMEKIIKLVIQIASEFFVIFFSNFVDQNSNPFKIWTIYARNVMMVKRFLLLLWIPDGFLPYSSSFLTVWYPSIKSSCQKEFQHWNLEINIKVLDRSQA